MSISPLPVFALIPLCFALVAADSAAEEITLSQAYQLALEHAPDVDIARFQIDGAEARKGQVLGKLLPQATAFGQWSKNKISYESDPLFPGDLDYPGQRYGVSVRQSLLAVSDGIELSRQNKLIQLSKDELRITEAELFSELLEAYLDILLSDAELVLLNDEILSVDAQLKEARALFKKNLIPVTEVLETESRLDILKSDLIMAEGQAAVSREFLSTLTGLPGGEPMAVTENLALLARFSGPDAAATVALASDPSIDAAQSKVEAAEKAVLREKARWVPDVYLSYNYQHSDVGFDNQRSPSRDTSTFAIDFSYPIFEGGARLARIKGASAEYSTAVTKLRAQQLDTETRARSAWLIFDAATQRLLSTKKAVTSADVNVIATRRSAKAGTARYTDVLLALAQHSRALRDLIDARFFHARAWVELELAVGASPAPLAKTLSTLLHR